MTAELAFQIFEQCVTDYHIEDHIDQIIRNPYHTNTVEHLLYKKCWVDIIQWHYEDLVREPKISPTVALDLKRKIDISNQTRTNLVEQLDDYFLDCYKNIKPSPHATINTESPAWAVDRLSILSVKIYHMNVEVPRNDARKDHHFLCTQKLEVLLSQKKDLINAINQLLHDISSGYKHMKVYRQFKMYNDEDLNPVLYNTKRKS